MECGVERGVGCRNSTVLLYVECAVEWTEPWSWLYRGVGCTVGCALVFITVLRIHCALCVRVLVITRFIVASAARTDTPRQDNRIHEQQERKRLDRAVIRQCTRRLHCVAARARETGHRLSVPCYTIKYPVPTRCSESAITVPSGIR